MLARLFRQNQPAVLLLLPAIAVALWPGARTEAAVPADAGASGMPLYAGLHAWMAATSWAAMAVGLVLALGGAFLLNMAANDAELFERRNNLPALLFVLLLGIQRNGLYPDPALLGVPFLALALARVWSLQGRPQVAARLFDTGLLIGLAALCYLPYAFLLVVVWASLAVMRPLAWREYVLPAVALFVVFTLASGVLWIFGPDSWHPFSTLSTEVHGSLGTVQHTRLYHILFLVWGIPFGLAAALAFASSYGRSIMREKNTRSSFLALVFALVLLGAFQYWLDHHVPAALVAMPLAILPVYALMNAGRSWLAELAVWGLFGLGLWARWG